MGIVVVMARLGLLAVLVFRPGVLGKAPAGSEGPVAVFTRQPVLGPHGAGSHTEDSHTRVPQTPFLCAYIQRVKRKVRVKAKDPCPCSVMRVITKWAVSTSRRQNVIWNPKQQGLPRMTVPFQVFEEARGLKQGATQVEVEHLIFGSSEIRAFRADHR